MSERTRAEQIAGIYQLALWLEQNPDVPIPWDLTGNPGTDINIHASHGENERAVVAAVARALPGKVDKSVWGPDGHYFGLKGKAPGGVGINVIAQRDEVCKRVVTGTREVKKTIPDPMVTVPTIEVTETVEDVEWVCEPILAAERYRKAVEDETVRAVLSS
jgi:hypothetical protein